MVEKSGIRSIKKINGIEYLYYMYCDSGGHQISKYCGRDGTDRAEVTALKTELDVLHRLETELQSERVKTRKRIERLKKPTKKIRKMIHS